MNIMMQGLGYSDLSKGMDATAIPGIPLSGFGSMQGDVVNLQQE
jgi:hypothetical protein